MKLLDIKGKYLTDVDTHSPESNIKTMSKMSDKNQTFKYSVQGELIADDKCLSYDDSKQPNVNLETCSGEEHQHWLLTNTSNIKLKNLDKCLTLNTETDNVSVMACNNSSDNQEWDIEEDDTDSSYLWDKYKGKTVVLVEADNPWYVNKDTTTIMKSVPQKYNVGELQYRNNADFKSNFVYDPNSHSLGMGHSYRDHLGEPCQKIEGFDANGNNTNQIIFYLFIVLVILIIYRYSR